MINFKTINQILGLYQLTLEPLALLYVIQTYYILEIVCGYLNWIKPFMSGIVKYIIVVCRSTRSTQINTYITSISNQNSISDQNSFSDQKLIFRSKTHFQIKTQFQIKNSISDQNSFSDQKLIFRSKTNINFRQNN